MINIAGVDDPAEKLYGSGTEKSEKEVLSSLSHEKFTLFLKHRPTIDKEAMGLFDLQLSGHAHKEEAHEKDIFTRPERILRRMLPCIEEVCRKDGGS